MGIEVGGRKDMGVGTEGGRKKRKRRGEERECW